MLGLAASAGSVILLPGCTLPERGAAVPKFGTTRATVLGIQNERFFPITDSVGLEKEFLASSERARLFHDLAVDAPLPRVQMLAISGGAENGAFGAGLLCGWSDNGTRPAIVTMPPAALSVPLIWPRFADMSPAMSPKFGAGA